MLSVLAPPSPSLRVPVLGPRSAFPLHASILVALLARELAQAQG